MSATTTTSSAAAAAAAVPVHIISIADYNKHLKGIQGTLMFPGEVWDCLSYCDTDAIKKSFNIRKKIKAVIITTNAHQGFNLILNRRIPYKYGLLCDPSVPESVPYNGSTRSSITMFPTGEAWIVV